MAVPSDLYDYLEKMDRDEEETEEEVCVWPSGLTLTSHIQ